MSEKIRKFKGKTKKKEKRQCCNLRAKFEEDNVAGQDVVILAGLPASLPCLFRQPGDKQTLH